MKVDLDASTMGRFQRYSTLILGIGLLMYGGTFFVIAGIDAPLSSIAGTVLLIGSGILFIVSGIEETVTLAGRTVHWTQLNGVGTILLAGGWMIASIPLAVNSPMFGAITLLGGLVLVFVGYQGMTDGPHSDLETTPSKTRITISIVLAVALFVFGFVVYPAYL
ncbi:hypothetical protein RBH26_10955 [Natronolimnohabitans sp. A-GB9]|uniref:hypothetical protein n=1 Tax=Natronolimnohabitans sp. A-GB9 TaxID=3069757 RepID=UPI0027AEA6F4|nr:hypothetical protein [Natronolimnohabitans sp. A-GB9]MDQ2050998.1 hypothetical protein [Natronolimnohabitans sp. A-GB9]